MVGASVAAGLVEVIDHRMWAVLPVVAASLFFAYRTYADYVIRLEDEHRRREVIDSPGTGHVRARSRRPRHAVERCARAHAGLPARSGARAALSATPCRRWRAPSCRARSRRRWPIGQPRTLPLVRLPSATDARVLQVKVLPVADGVTLLWHDVTERTQRRARAQAERRAAGARGGRRQRRPVAVEPADAGVLRVGTLARDDRPAAARRDRRDPDEWLERVHPDDIADLNADARSASRRRDAEVFQHEHRIRHEDGTYRRFLCRGVAVRGARPQADRIAGSLTDTTEQAIAQERLRSVGFLDPLTGLCNRAVFVEGLGRRLEEFKRAPRRQLLRRALPRSRSLQGRQRQPRPPGRRRAADRGRRAGSSRACGRATRSRGWAATSSPSS